MTQPVFISYARDASRAHALALHQALGGTEARIAFLDTQDIAHGERFPNRLVEALFAARVVVIFAEPAYFTRRYCLMEFRVARQPYLDPAEEGPRPELVVALPPRGIDPMLERFPDRVRTTHWPFATEPEALARVVRERLAERPPTLGEYYARRGDMASTRARLLDLSAVPPPGRIGPVPFSAPRGIRESLGDAFVGRADDLWRIHDVLTTERGTPPAAGHTCSLEAAGGFGKTRLALEYLYRFGPDHFPGGLFWIDAEQPPEPQLHAVLRALDPGAPPTLDAARELPAGVAGAVERVLRRRARSAPPVLFVVDGVPEPSVGSPPLPLTTWCPAPGEVAVLATSRRSVSLGGGRVVRIPVGALDPWAAVLLLAPESLRRRLKEAQWREIAEWVARLPLALDLLRNAMQAGAISPEELLAQSRMTGTTSALDGAMDALRGNVPEGALRGITEALSMSVERLDESARAAARLIAWLSPAPVPDLLLGLVEGGPFTPEVRATLRARHFVDPLSAPGEDAAPGTAYFGSMHPVPADFLRAGSPDPDGEVEILVRAFQEVTGARAGSSDARLHALAAAGGAIAALTRNALATAPDAGALDRAFVRLRPLAAALHEAGRYELAQACFERAFSVLSSRLGREHPGTLAAAHGLALARWARGDFQGANAVQGEVAQIRARVLGPEHADTLEALHVLAIIRRALGDYAGAQELEERVLEARRRLLGADAPATLATMNNLSETLRERGEYRRAQELLELVLEVRRRRDGAEDPDTLTAMLNLAHTLLKRGDLVEAQALEEQVVEGRRRVLGAEHPETLVAMNNLASILEARGAHAEAQALQEAVLEARRRILGEEHPHTLIAMNNLAETLRARGDYAGAQALQEEHVPVVRRTLGAHHPETLTATMNLAHTLRRRGDAAGAQALLEPVLEERRRTLGEDHPDTLTVMNNLGLARRVLGDLASAQSLYEHVLQARRRIFGERHHATSAVAWNLLHTMEQLGRREDALALLDRDLAWLLESDPVLLAAPQQMIRGALSGVRERLEHGEAGGGPPPPPT